MGKKKVLQFEKLSGEQCSALLAFLDGPIQDAEVDAESLDEEFGKGFMASLRGLHEHLRVRANADEEGGES